MSRNVNEFYLIFGTSTFKVLKNTVVEADVAVSEVPYAMPWFCFDCKPAGKKARKC